jgi:hypothetical protein
MKLLYVAAAFLLACFALSALAQGGCAALVDDRVTKEERA